MSENFNNKRKQISHPYNLRNAKKIKHNSKRITDSSVDTDKDPDYVPEDADGRNTGHESDGTRQ